MFLLFKKKRLFFSFCYYNHIPGLLRQIPIDGGLKTLGAYHPTVLEARDPKSRGWRVWSPRGSRGGSFLASPGWGWTCLALFGLWACHSSFCCLHTASPRVSLNLPPFKGTSHRIQVPLLSSMTSAEETLFLNRSHSQVLGIRMWIYPWVPTIQPTTGFSWDPPRSRWQSRDLTPCSVPL